MDGWSRFCVGSLRVGFFSHLGSSFFVGSLSSVGVFRVAFTLLGAFSTHWVVKMLLKSSFAFVLAGCPQHFCSALCKRGPLVQV